MVSIGTLDRLLTSVYGGIVVEELRRLAPPLTRKRKRRRPQPYKVNRTGWPAGPWDNEPDRLAWTDPETGYPCLMRRSTTFGGWCGYVAIPEDHPMYGVAYSEIDVDVHGGLTYANPCDGDPDTGICHPGSASVWWLGFDCGHMGDRSPNMESVLSKLRVSPALTEVYRDLKFVMDEVTSLAKQLKEKANGD